MSLLDELKINFKIEDDCLLINNYRVPLACFESCDDLSTLKIMSKNILSLTDQNTYNELLPFIKKIKNEKPKILINDNYINARKEYIKDELDRLSYDLDVYDQSTLRNTGKTRFKDFI